ncbi:MAG: NAD-dependent protein deacylase [Clostridiales Family XIII bacterium]|jgi:NAD-dependent deacetylase|nr:NAD-dependent protein deacylase [Clostridiales Family XIII bacterium]
MKNLKDIIEGSENIVFFGGAGVSTESGIPDFRSESGLYKAQQEYGRSPESIISHSAFVSDPELFYSYYKGNMLFPDAEPNGAHKALARLEQDGKLSAVVTQNIDGLHQMAGSERVYELHGSVHRNYCMSCGAKFGLDYILDEANCKGESGGISSVPRCDACGGIVRPDVVLYEEALDDSVVSGAVRAISQADTLIVGGTSLVVYPAAGFLSYFSGSNLVLINKSETGYDSKANLVIREPIGEVMSALFAAE